MRRLLSRDGLLALTWILVVSASFWPLLEYVTASGELAPRRARIASQGRVASAAEGSRRVILTVHPRCAASRTNLIELRRVLAELAQTEQLEPPLDTSILFLGASAEDASLLALANTIPGARLEPRLSYERMRELGSLLSGEIFAFDGDGVVQFHGELTATRDPEGDRSSHAALLRALRPKAVHAARGVTISTTEAFASAR